MDEERRHQPGTGTSDPLTPQGQIEQYGRLAHGLKYNAAGRRRAGRMLAGLVVLLAVVVVLLALT